jgi:dienelactone hydrolase
MRFTSCLLVLALLGTGAASAKDTAVIESLVLSAPTSSGTSSVRVSYPTGRGRFPVVVVSQGARSTAAMYARLAQRWAADGYVVIQLLPPDLAPIGDPRSGAGRRLPGAVDARINDIRFSLAALGQVEERARPLRGKLDRDRIAVVGHSLGALAALLATGPKLRYVADGTAAPAGEAAIDAVVLIGDPSRTGIVPENAWLTLEKPVLLATGTNDEGEAQAGSPRLEAVFALGEPPTTAARHELFVRGMDVCLGGVLCRVAPGTTPDMAALSAIAETSSAFFAAYLRNDAPASQWLRRESPPDFANGRARLRLR